jgi:HAD superfamily hydrolase (TIGR01549 family)
MIRAIIFDCFGVLTQDNWKEFWTALPSTRLRSSARELNKNHDNGVLTLDEFTKQLAQLTDKPMAEISAIFRDTGPIKNRQLIDYIKELKLNYKIGIISNIGTSWIEDQLLSADEQSLFDISIYSYRVGMTKPNPQIYLLAASQLKVEPNECVFVDDVEEYCEAAEALDMKSITYDTFFNFKKNLTKILSNN